MTQHQDIHTGLWHNRPATLTPNAEGFTASATKGSDFWRDTYYGFTRDTGHALLFGLRQGQSIEVTVLAEFVEQFDQAGLMLRRDSTTWTKAGLELADGVVGIGSVVTRQFSDWSSWPITNDDAARPVRLRASWTREALVIRARLDDQPWRLLRVAPLAGTRAIQAGPYLCAPSRAGFSATFRDITIGEADADLH